MRLDAELDDKVRRAAARAGESVSEFLRQAASQRADDVLSSDRGHLFADVIGIVHTDGGVADRTGDAFADLLEERAGR